jgi:hypothetical protein
VNTEKRTFKELPKTARGAAHVRRFDVAKGREIHDLSTRFGVRLQAQILSEDRERCSGCGGRCASCGSQLFVDTSVMNVMPEELRDKLCASEDPLVKELRAYLDATRLMPISGEPKFNGKIDAEKFIELVEGDLHSDEQSRLQHFRSRGGIEQECSCGQAWMEHPDHPLTHCPHCGLAVARSLPEKAEVLP